MIVFAAITPHPPMLIPSIGKEKGTEILAKTLAGFTQLQEQLYLTRPDTILLISPHQQRFAESFVFNAHDTLLADYKDLGDVTTQDQWQGDHVLAAQLAQHCRDHFSVRLISEPGIRYSSAVPLHFLTKNLPHVRILPLGMNDGSETQHLSFGYMMKEMLVNTPKRIAIIASGDLSHTLTDDAPGGYDEAGAAFDQMLVDSLQYMDLESLRNIDEEVVTRSKNCGYRGILMLFGIIADMYRGIDVYSYEHPFGIGYLNAECHLSE